jgi:hypothetical protein
MHRVLRRLKARGIKVSALRALEVFGGKGEFHTVEYMPAVRSLEAWEIDPACVEELRSNLKGAVIKNVNAFDELQKTNTRYNLIVIDNPLSNYDSNNLILTQGGWCEHFDLFPDIFRVAMNPCVMVLNVVPHINAKIKRQHPWLFNDSQLARRSNFYDTGCPQTISFRTMVSAYKDLARKWGFELKWWFVERRSFVYYLVLYFEREKAVFEQAI